MSLPVAARDDQLMQRALTLAASSGDDVPVGALVISESGTIIAEASNERESGLDPTAHAEVLALRRAAASLGTRNLHGCTLVVTLEPCVMCAGAILQSRVSRVVFGAWDDKAGAVGSMYDVVRDRRLPHRVEVVAGVRADESAVLLRAFFESRRS